MPSDFKLCFAFNSRATAHLTPSAQTQKTRSGKSVTRRRSRAQNPTNWNCESGVSRDLQLTYPSLRYDDAVLEDAVDQDGKALP